jgi:YVTN family beta-propeller protein
VNVAIDQASPRGQHLRRWRVFVVIASVVAAVVGSIALATRNTGDTATTAGITSTLRVPSHPGWITADAESLWLAVNGDPLAPAVNQALVRVDVATGAVQQTVSAEGQATFVTRVGSKLVASVQHVGDDAFRPRRLLALDWRTGRVLFRRGFDGPVDHLVSSGNDLWALQVRPGALLHLDPTTLAPVASPLPLPGGRMLDVAAGAGHLWVTAVDTGELLRIDPATGAVERIAVGGTPTGVVVAGGSVWVTDPKRGRVVRRDTRTLRSVGNPIAVGARPTWLAATARYVFVADADDGTVTRIDVRSGKVAGRRIRVAPPGRSAAGFAIALAGPVVWISSYASNSLVRISAATDTPRAPATTAPSAGATSAAAAPLPAGGEVAATIDVPAGSGGFAVGAGGVWSGDDDGGTLTRIDPKTNKVVKKIPIPSGAGGAAAGDGAVWVVNTATNTVARIDPRTSKVVATVHVGKQPDGISVSPGAVWVANGGGPTVSRIDPATNKVVATIRVGPARACCSEHMGIFADDGVVWAAVPNLNALVQIDPNNNTVLRTEPVPTPPCGFLAVEAGQVWAAGGGCGDLLMRIDGRTSGYAPITTEEPHPIGLALLSGSLWVAVLGSKKVDRVDPLSGKVIGRLDVGGLPIRLAAGYGSVWLRDDTGRVLRIRPAG